MSYAGLLNMTLIQKRRVLTYDAQNKQITNWSTVNAAIVCTVQDKSGSEEIEVKGKVFNVDAIGFFLDGADVQKGDHIINGSKHYEVEFVEDAAGRGHHVEAGLVIIDEEG